MLKQLALAGVCMLAAGTLNAQSTAAPAAAAPTTHAAATTSSTKKHEQPSKEQITMAQQNLTKAGLYKGKADGKWNDELSSAIKKYQTQNKLKVTGKLDEETLKKLEPPAPAMAPASP
ncbi:MAG TPA: peptidoglycan-binding domain-containing protein [Gemmatimonadales bacterium]|jgi:peptidoglycan hydrolase-like protein with peptidoglycan-binding domain